MITERNRYAFILGCERSGSTWLSNICDAHPATEFFMEPFADYANIFPGFPHRNLYVSGGSKALTELIREGYGSLSKLKYPFLHTRDGPKIWKTVDTLLVSAVSKISVLKLFEPSTRLDQYNLLHLNQAAGRHHSEQGKNKYIDIFITKELRLNFKLKLINEAFPGAKYIVITRNPRAQLSSILKLFEKGNLGELQRSLFSFREYVILTSRFAKYHDVVRGLQESDLIGMLVLWWIINYETVILDCKDLNTDYLVVQHENLSENPIGVVGYILELLDLDMPKNVEDYIAISTTHSRVIKSAVDTIRDSKSYYKNAIQNAREEVIVKIHETAMKLEIIPEISHYFADSDRS